MSEPVRLSVQPITSDHRFRPGDDVVLHLLAAMTSAGMTLEDGDVLCVASKIVAIVEGALITPPPTVADQVADERALVRELARARADVVVAESPWVTVTRTHHGFVAANGGIDRSNVPDDGWLDLPADPDASAARLREALGATSGRDVAVVVTDTFGRPWRLGQTDVALGAAGLAVLRDERGSTDLNGRELGVTIAAVGDAIAGAADLVRSKASATPFVLLRGLRALTSAGGAQPGRAADLVRPLEEDMFRRGAAEAVLEGLTARRTVRSFAIGRVVPRGLIEEAVTVATTAPAPHHSRPWRVIRLTDGTRTRLLDAMTAAWRVDLVGDGLDAATIERRIRRSDDLHRRAPELLAVFVDLSGMHRYPDARRTRAERDLFVLSGGAAIEALLVALAARGLGAAWTSSTVFPVTTIREVLELPAEWEPLGTVAVGWPEAAVPRRAEPTLDGVLTDL
jgi:coenzyme F420-0:L-glutamate ligase/coenzyme F420-1:gamma-L-glutamate ligase